MKKSQKVILDNRTVEVSKLPLGKYAELLKALKELPKKVPELSKMPTNEIIAKLPALIGDCLPDIINILNIATDLKVEEINELGLDETTRLVMAIVEVNNFGEVFENIKKVMSLPQTKKLQPIL
jgi:hypothetical protein